MQLQLQLQIRRRVISSDVCAGGRAPTSKVGMRESVGYFFQALREDAGRGGGGVSLYIIIM